MAEIISTPKKYYQLSSKQGGIFRWEKNADNVKVDGITGYLRDITLCKDNPPGGRGPVIVWKFHFVDEVNELDDDNAVVSELSINEGSYTFERLGNLLLNVKHNGKLTIFAYKSSKISAESTGISMKVDGEKVSYKFDKFNETTKRYEGLPEGDAKSRVGFWQKEIMGTWYESFFGRKWDGNIIDRTNDPRSGSSSETTEASPASKISAEDQIWIGKTLAALEAKGDREVTLLAWAGACDFFKSKVASEEARKEFLLNFQNYFDKTFSGTDVTFKLDGTYEEGDLPF